MPSLIQRLKLTFDNVADPFADTSGAGHYVIAQSTPPPVWDNSKYHAGGASLALVAPSYLNYDSGTAFLFHSGNYLVDFWFYPTDASGTPNGLLTWFRAGSGIRIRQDGTTLYVFGYPTTMYGTININAWNHVCLYQDDNVTTDHTLEVNGIIVGTSSRFGVCEAPDTGLGVGNYETALPSILNFTGWIDEINIYEGLAPAPSGKIIFIM